MSRYYVTTPIYYVNDVPHLGTAYSTIVADVLRRVALLRGKQARMLTGTDEHGIKLQREAEKRGQKPADFVREMSDRFEAVWPKLEIQPDDFVRTTQPRHEQRVQELWKTIEAKGDLYLGVYDEWYCVGCESYKTEKELIQPGNMCNLHLSPVERVKEETYFFRLSKYADKLLALYEKPGFVEPEARRNEVRSFVESGLKDLSVSRTSFSWGIPVPGDPKHVMFVWFDALANYWSVLQGDPALEAFWPPGGEVTHIVGKDIVRFHAVYWPAILMSAGIEPPTKIFAHGFLTFNGQKMSKSLRNAVEPLGIAKAFGEIAGSEAAGADVLRYQLLRAIAFGQDGDFDLSAMVERYNADLGKNLGNLLARTLGLCAKSSDGKVPERGEETALEKELAAAVDAQWLEMVAAWGRLEPHRALERLFAISSLANQYVERAAPWAAEKKGDRARVGTILNTLLGVLGALSVAIWPVLPAKSDEMRRQLGLAVVRPKVGIDGLALGSALVVRKGGEALAASGALFPTIDEAGAGKLLETLTPKIVEAGAGASAGAGAGAAAGAGAGAGASITYDTFAVVDLRVGLVKTCERVPKKDKLLKLSVDVGEPEARTIVAGLALTFKPEDLVGRRVVVVANLAPREFGKGLVSHGMLLATGPSEQLILATVAGDAAPGAKLK
jgi:methionyl-tRNA synthetase